MTPHLLALDIDGTIVDYDDKLSDRVRGVVRACRAQGHHIVISTGRSLSGALDVANRLGLTEGFVVVSNGAVIASLNPDTDNGYELVHVETFNPGPALTRMNHALPTSLCMVEDANLERWASADFPVGDLAAGDDLNIVRFAELKTLRATRIVLRELHGSREEFADAVEKIGLHGVTYSVGWSNWLDIAPEGVSKASGLARVAEMLGIDKQHTVGAGDGTNDHEMMEWVAHGIVMGQAGQKLKDLGTVITGTVEEDGLATALQDYFELSEDAIRSAMR